jgi:hypothetical protein
MKHLILSTTLFFIFGTALSNAAVPSVTVFDNHDPLRHIRDKTAGRYQCTCRSQKERCCFTTVYFALNNFFAPDKSRKQASITTLIIFVP